jgi:hypothetical protein
MINSLINYKRDWKALLLYTVFIVSFLSNKYYFQSVLSDYTVAFTASFLVFIILCIFYNGINLEDTENLILLEKILLEHQTLLTILS